MIEAQAIRRKDELVRRLHRDLPKEVLHELLQPDTSIYDKRLSTVKIGHYTLTFLPFTVQGEHAGEQPYIKLERRKGDEVVASVTLYPEGRVNRGRREWVVATGTALKGREEVNSERALKVASAEVNGISQPPRNVVRMVTANISLQEPQRPLKAVRY